MNPRVEDLLAEFGFIRVAEHPALRSALSRCKRTGDLVAPLPGVYLHSAHSHTDWLRAVSAWAGPAGVLHAETAASIWLPDLAGRIAAVTHPRLHSRCNVIINRRMVPDEFVARQAGVRFALPVYAAVELAAADDGRALCEALRRRLADQASIKAALACLARAPGQARRSAVVAATAGNPWSYAELRLQRILVNAGIGDWVANRPLRLAGRLLRPDIRFRRCRLIVEFDGRGTHDNPAQYLADRERLNLFEAWGFHVLRFGWEHLDQPDYVVAAVRAALSWAVAGRNRPGGLDIAGSRQVMACPQDDSSQ